MHFALNDLKATNWLLKVCKVTLPVIFLVFCQGKNKQTNKQNISFFCYHTFFWSLTGFDCFFTFMLILSCMLPGGLKGDRWGCHLCDDWLKAWWLPWSLKRGDGGPGNGLSPQPWVLLRGSEDCTRWWIWHCQGVGERRVFAWKWSATHQTSLKLTGRRCRLSFFLLLSSWHKYV